MGEKRVLVVEDDRATQYLMNTLLRRDGLVPTIVANGAEALDLLEESEFDVIILDLMMPIVSGHDVIEALEQRQSRTPIVVCTAAGATIEGFHTPRVRAVIRKPFDIETLSAVVLAAINDPA
jgi:CheY-like chemotaxis protein